MKIRAWDNSPRVPPEEPLPSNPGLSLAPSPGDIISTCRQCSPGHLLLYPPNTQSIPEYQGSAPSYGEPLANQQHWWGEVGSGTGPVVLVSREGVERGPWSVPGQVATPLSVAGSTE